MLKKLLLPLFITTASLLIASSVYADCPVANPGTAPTRPTDPCSGMTNNNQRQNCYASYNAQLTVWTSQFNAWRQRNTAWQNYCSNSSYSVEDRRNCGCSLTDDGHQPFTPPDQPAQPVQPIQPAQPIQPGNDPNVDEPDQEDVDDDNTLPEAPNGREDGYHSPVNPPAITSSCRYFLGLKSWDCNTNFESLNQETEIAPVVLTVAANIFDDILMITTYLILGYIIYGGYLYIFAAGDVGKVEKGKKALNQAFIGLAITLSATIIISTIRIIVLHGNNAFGLCATTECVSPDDLIQSTLTWVLGIGGAVALIFVVGGGIMYMTSEGDPSKLQKAKNIIKYALIGLVIVALSETITIFATNLVRKSKESAESNNTALIINKEEHEKTI